jgi:hypothetical protein
MFALGCYGIYLVAAPTGGQAAGGRRRADVFSSIAKKFFRLIDLRITKRRGQTAAFGKSVPPRFANIHNRPNQWLHRPDIPNNPS